MADNLGLPYGTLYGWVKQERRHKYKDLVESSENPESLEAAQREIAFLKRELRDTQDALTVLKNVYYNSNHKTIHTYSWYVYIICMYNAVGESKINYL